MSDREGKLRGRGEEMGVEGGGAVYWGGGEDGVVG